MKIGEFTTEYQAIWEKAEELAEKEAIEFEKSPWKRKIVIYRPAKRLWWRAAIGITAFVAQTRNEYKERRREKHLLMMVATWEAMHPQLPSEMET